MISWNEENSLFKGKDVWSVQICGLCLGIVNLFIAGPQLDYVTNVKDNKLEVFYKQQKNNTKKRKEKGIPNGHQVLRML